MSQLIKENPYLSIIIPSRNDDHGENAFKRMEVSLNGLFEQLEKYKIESELILIDWNPPKDKPKLKEIIKWPKKINYCTIRIIEVNPEIHQKFPYSDKLPLYVVGAMNSGIRRARGKFILPSVIDLLYSDEIMSFISSKKLNENERYRVNRCDVNKSVLEKNTLKEQLDYCGKNIIKFHGYNPNYRQEGLPSLHTDACGDFQLMSRKFWHLLRGYREGDIISAYVDALLSFASYKAGVKEVVLNENIRIYHIDHCDKFVDQIKVKRPAFEKIFKLIFRLIVPILPVFIATKIVFLYQGTLKNKSKTEVRGIPTLDYIEFLNLARGIIDGKNSYIFNDENWGLNKEKLSEFIIKKASWDKN